MDKFTGRLRSLTLLFYVMLFSGSAMAMTLLGVIEGTTATVSFYGGLLSSPCILRPDSQNQSIDLGDINPRDL